MENDVLRIAGKEFHSRLIIGTGKYKNFQEMTAAHEASGAEMVTVAVGEGAAVGASVAGAMRQAASPSMSQAASRKATRGGVPGRPRDLMAATSSPVRRTEPSSWVWHWLR